jgi:thiol-disulfide isomerase/thioredoxin
MSHGLTEVTAPMPGALSIRIGRLPRPEILVQRLLFAVLLSWPSMLPAVQPGDAAPVVIAPQEDGETFDMASLAGRVVYVDFWASWCAPCRKTLPAFDQLHQRYDERGFTVLGVNLDRRRAEALRMLSRIPVGFPMVFDPEGEWARVYDPPGMPSGYLVDRRGVVRYRHVGYSETDLPDLIKKIEKLLEETS